MLLCVQHQCGCADEAKKSLANIPFVLSPINFLYRSHEATVPWGSGGNLL